MSSSFNPKSKIVASSLFTLKASAFDHVNYRSGGEPANSTMSADTPLGVLAGSVLMMNSSLEVDVCTDAAGKVPVGWAGDNATGSAFQNAPAIASGKVSVWTGSGAIYLISIFETHAKATAWAAKTLSTAYAVGVKLYSSPYGLLTNEADTDSNVIGIVCKTPSSTDLEIGVISRI